MRRSSTIAWLGCAALLLGPRLATASLIQIPFISPRDAGMAGNVVATPENGGAILLTNPAGVAGVSAPELDVSVLPIRSDVKYENPATGYETTSSELAVAPVLWFGMPASGGWSLGGGLYGTTGASFNFPGNAAAGIPNRILTELSVIQLGLVAGREIAPGLRLGVELSPTYAKIRARFPSPAGPVSFDTDGFGVGGTVGLLYRWSEATTLGLAYRSPGIVYLRGDGHVGSASTDADLELHLPQSVAFGVASYVLPRLLVSAQARWTNYSEFEDGDFTFSGAPALNQPLLRDTRAVFRYGVGVEYALVETAKIRAGVSREEWMIEEKAMTPLLLDNTDLLSTIGLGVDFRPWRVDLQVGVPLTEDRVVSADQQPAFPGRYEQEGLVWSIGVKYRFE